jgi:hypothetical protein
MRKISIIGFNTYLSSCPCVNMLGVKVFCGVNALVVYYEAVRKID